MNYSSDHFLRKSLSFECKKGAMDYYQCMPGEENVEMYAIYLPFQVAAT